MRTFTFSSDEDNESITRTVTTDSLTEVLDAFLMFLWACTFNYVNEVVAVAGDAEFSSDDTE